MTQASFVRSTTTEQPQCSLRLEISRTGATADATIPRPKAVGTTWNAYLCRLLGFALTCQLPAWRLASIEFALQGLHLARPALHQSPQGHRALARTDPPTNILLLEVCSTRVFYHSIQNPENRTNDDGCLKMSAFRETSSCTRYFTCPSAIQVYELAHPSISSVRHRDEQA